MNKPAEELLGYALADLKGKALASILPPRIAELLKEYVEYEANANDVGEVLSKVQSFSIIGKDGKESGYRLKVNRTESAGDMHQFQLVFQDKTGLRKSEALRKVIQENFKGHEVLDPDLGMPDRYSLGKDIELMGYYRNKSDLRSSFAILQLDHYDELFSQYGRPACINIVKHAATVCRQNLRPDDVVGSVNYRRVGVLLVDTTPDSERMVFNRLRWQIAANPFLLQSKATLGLSVSISFARIGGRVGDKTMIEECEAALDTLDGGTANALIEVQESSKKKAD